MLHTIGELGHVWLKSSVCCPTGRPAIIEDNVKVAKISQTVIDDFLSGPQEQLLADIASKGIPIVLLNFSNNPSQSKCELNTQPIWGVRARPL